MPPGTTNGQSQQLETLVLSLERRIALLEATPLLFRKDVSRLLGISERTLDRRMKRRDFPKPQYDAGRPKWRPSAFAGQGLSG